MSSSAFRLVHGMGYEQVAEEKEGNLLFLEGEARREYYPLFSRCGNLSSLRLILAPRRIPLPATRSVP